MHSEGTSARPDGATRETFDVCPVWCSGHDDTYQPWEGAVEDGPVRDHAGVTITVAGASTSVNQREFADHTEPSAVEIYLDTERADMLPAEARAFAYAILMLADVAERGDRRNRERERNAFELGRDAERMGLQ